MSLTSSFNLSVCPRRSFQVRQRRMGGRTYLIRLAEIYSIDALSEAIWSLCDGETPAAEMLGKLGLLFPNLTAPELVQAIVNTVLFLAQRKMIDSWEPPLLPPPLPEAPYSEPLAALMQAFQRHPETPWAEDLPRPTAEKVQHRFFRICYESYWASCEDKRHALNELAFRNRWGERFLINRARATREFGDNFGLRSWYFIPPQNKIIMVRDRAVYEGDVDHRL